MNRQRTGQLVGVMAAVALGAGMAAPAQAQMAVIDAAAVAKLLQQITYWKQQITAMATELNQLKQTHASLTGPRGMQALLPLADAQRNYLPKDWAEIADVLRGQSVQYGALANSVSALVNSRAVLTGADLGQMTPQERASVEEARRQAAGRAVLTREAFAQASARFASLAQLVQAIGGAVDAKAILDLQGRIDAEQAMLENEQAKLTLLSQVADADRLLQEQQLRELAIAGHGDFRTRLHPLLP
jgi:type IV secretion system protein VirB5